MGSYKFTVSFNLLLCVDEHLLFVGGRQVDARLGCRPVAETVDAEGHLGGGQLGRASQVGHFLSQLVDGLALEEVAVACTLVVIQFGFIQGATVLRAEVSQEQVQVGVLRQGARRVLAFDLDHNFGTSYSFWRLNSMAYQNGSSSLCGGMGGKSDCAGASAAVTGGRAPGLSALPDSSRS